MSGTGDLPPDPEGDAARRVARSFLVVRVVRGGLLLVFLALALVGVEARGWPRSVVVAIAAGMVLQVGWLAASYRRYVRDTAR